MTLSRFNGHKYTYGTLHCEVNVSYGMFHDFMYTVTLHYLSSYRVLIDIIATVIPRHNKQKL